MKEIENKKKEKRVKRDQKLLITWGMGFFLVVVIVAMNGGTTIELWKLAELGLILILIGTALPTIVDIIKKFREKRELKKYDTGTLAQIENEA